MINEDEYKLNMFQLRCLRKLLNVYRPRKVSDEEIRERSGTRRSDERRLSMIWLKIEQNSQGYTDAGTRRRTQKRTTGRDLAENQK